VPGETLPPGLTFQRDSWPALLAATTPEARGAAMTVLEAERGAQEFSPEEAAVHADTYGLAAMRSSLSGLHLVTEPERGYQPPPELRAAHAEAERAVEKLISLLPNWATAPGQPALEAGIRDYGSPDQVPLPPPPGSVPVGPPPAPPAANPPRFRLLLGLSAGLLAGWLLWARNGGDC